MSSRTSLVVPGLLGTLGPGTLVVMSGRTSRVFPGLLDMGLCSRVWYIGHPGMSRVFPGHLRTFGPGTLVVMSGI